MDEAPAIALARALRAAIPQLAAVVDAMRAMVASCDDHEAPFAGTVTAESATEQACSTAASRSEHRRGRARQDESREPALVLAIDAVGSCAALGRALGLSDAAVGLWKSVPPPRVAAVSALSGVPYASFRNAPPQAEPIAELPMETHAPIAEPAAAAGQSEENSLDWTETEIATLRALWAEGRSTSAIGAVLGTSKNAIVGKAHRLKLPARPSPIRRTGRAPKPERLPRNRPSAPAAPRAVAPPAPAADRAPTTVVVTETPLPPPPLRLRPAGSSPAHGTCSYPIGEPGSREFRYCDAPVEGRQSYCPEHHALCCVRVPMKSHQRMATVREQGSSW